MTRKKAGFRRGPASAPRHAAGGGLNGMGVGPAAGSRSAAGAYRGRRTLRSPYADTVPTAERWETFSLRFLILENKVPEPSAEFRSLFCWISRRRAVARESAISWYFDPCSAGSA